MTTQPESMSPITSRTGSVFGRGRVYQRTQFWMRSHRLSSYKASLSLRLKPSRNKIHEETSNLDVAEKVLLDSELVPKDGSFLVGLVKDGEYPPNYPKFERFLKTNGLPYDYCDIRSSSWLDDIKRFSLIVWTPTSLPWELDESREKLHYIRCQLGALTYPTLDEVMFYENKLLQYYFFKALGYPVIETFVSYDYDEALNWIEKADYPFVSKMRTGSASLGVTLITSRSHAKRLVNRIFRRGLSTYVPSLRQKNYVLFQKLVKNHGFDLRVIVIDENNIFGYFRIPPKGEFRASGLGNVLKTDLPKEAVKIALEATKRTGFTNLSIDFLQSTSDNKFYIIEASNFIQVETSAQLEINGIPGKYRHDSGTDTLVFTPGRYWIQELMLKRFLETKIPLIRQNRP